MKRAQDFLVDSALGEKSFNIPQAEKKEDEQIVLSIEEGAIPVNLLRDARAKAKVLQGKSILRAISEISHSFAAPHAKDKATFFRLLAIMLNAGVPLIKSLDTIAEQTVNRTLRVALYDVARSIEKGGTLSASMLNYPKIFSEEYLGMIHAGEASGQLNHILVDLAVEVEKSAALRRKVKSALMYPTFVIFLLVAVIAAMLVYVIPKIADLFLETGQTLPLVTRIVIKTADILRFQWEFVIGGIVAVVLAFIGFRSMPQGRYATDWLLLHIPVFGTIVQKSLLARFARSLANLLSSGVPIIKALTINSHGLGNVVYKRRVELASEDIARGIPLGESLRDSPEFPAMMVQMISVGEQTAQLDSIGIKVAEYYEGEVDTAVSGISSVIEPVILVVVGIVVGTIVAAVMLPLIQLTQFSSSL